MEDDIEFRFSTEGLPEGEALTWSEIEQNLLERLKLRDGKCLDSLWSLTILYKQAGYLDQASGCMERFIELTEDPEKIGSGYLALGQLEESRGDFVAAAKQYRGALAMEPCSTATWYFIHNNLGYSLNQQGEHDAAVPYLQQALKIDPERPNAYKNLGLSHEALGNIEKAAALFVAATQVNASDSRSLAHLDALLEAHPVLEIDVHELRDQVEACRMAVKIARDQQPDFEAHWEKMRENQKPK
jgi:tetratricopeptide (TPR) repeat protein